MDSVVRDGSIKARNFWSGDRCKEPAQVEVEVGVQCEVQGSNRRRSLSVDVASRKGAPPVKPLVGCLAGCPLVVTGVTGAHLRYSRRGSCSTASAVEII